MPIIEVVEVGLVELETPPVAVGYQFKLQFEQAIAVKETADSF